MLIFETVCIRVMEGLFFAGLSGCALVVVLSWISILRSGFTSKDHGLPAADHAE
jgi:hypothetical protein